MNKGKIIKVKFGYNPNSSSLGISVILMLMGAAISYIVIAFISSIIRIWRKPPPK